MTTEALLSAAGASLAATLAFPGSEADSAAQALAAAAAPGPEAPDPADLSLVIEEDPSGQYVYKTVDRITGEVLAQYPREALLNLRDHADYAQGKVVDTRA